MYLIICNTDGRQITAELVGDTLFITIKQEGGDTKKLIPLGEIERVLGDKLDTLSNIERHAALFAIAAHESIGQRRKYTNHPYWHHPFEVADILCRQATHDANMLAAAYLHDVLEDTPAARECIYHQFGEDITELVTWLTAPKSTGSRLHRARAARLYAARATSRAKTIKIADIQSNIKTIVDHDRGFAKVYIPEKAAMMDVLTQGNSKLWSITNGLIEAAWMKLESTPASLDADR